jgi:tetratricopeptide (TPR) repeat protein
MGLILLQINLSEAEYNLGRWEAAENRLRPLDLASGVWPLTRAGLLQQRAWIAAHRGRATEALELCAQVNPRWLPATYRAEYHFTRAASLLAAGRLAEADAALDHAGKIAKRLSSKRNALFLGAEVAAARGDWARAESLCRAAANHPFRGQGGAGLLLWARALEHLGRSEESERALRLAVERDPESEAAKIAATQLSRAVIRT